MANTLTEVTPKLLAQGLMALRENAVMPRLVNSSYDTLAAQKGATIDIPIPSAIASKAVVPASTPATTQDFAPTAATITLDQWYEAPFYLTDKDILTAMEGTIPMQASEAVKSLANRVDSALLALHTSIYGFAGVAGTDPFGSSTTEATEARKELNNQLAPLGDRRMVINADAEANALGLRAFQDMSFSGDASAINEGKINHKLGFDWYMNQNVPEFTCGARTGDIAINYATAAVGDASIAVDGGTGAFAIGDQFTVAGDSQTYVATNTADSAGATLSFSPTMKVAWASNAVLTPKGTASTAYAQNFVFHRDCIGFATRPLVDNTEGLGNLIQSAVDPVSGLTLRLEVSREHKRTRFSYDILYGMTVVRAEYGCRLWGA